MLCQRAADVNAHMYKMPACNMLPYTLACVKLASDMNEGDEPQGSPPKAGFPVVCVCTNTHKYVHHVNKYTHAYTVYCYACTCSTT